MYDRQNMHYYSWYQADDAVYETRSPNAGDQRHEHHERGLLDQDSQQRESQRGSAGAQGAGRLASRLHRLVERHGAGWFPAIAGVSAHGLFGRSARLGQIRL